ncbi:hypothetical protein HOP50_03g21720 [Chloropicon primus]|uniref:Uncharacterized protein n=1 Tax=Chloropicon primus TaxID=1764295 RepID=A0A5B8MHW0_9CHLO|nr:hypothetical protein A3770_03p21720 [Chloropicon primus]UPQ98866.1 hypothetical protein HOP50_03g21720 [Chloropicon primus]|eukprot:QDZ19654.1 hypothetical protein A3770_03p21720 [Chloropicon primus]
MDASKLDELCDFSEQDKEAARYRKFESEVSPSSTYAVDDNWRMVPMKDLHPLKFALLGERGTRGAGARSYHISVPRKVIEESKFRLVRSNQSKHNSFSLTSHVAL